MYVYPIRVYNFGNKILATYMENSANTCDVIRVFSQHIFPSTLAEFSRIYKGKILFFS